MRQALNPPPTGLAHDAQRRRRSGNTLCARWFVMAGPLSGRREDSSMEKEDRVVFQHHRYRLSLCRRGPGIGDHGERHFAHGGLRADRAGDRHHVAGFGRRNAGRRLHDCQCHRAIQCVPGRHPGRSHDAGEQLRCDARGAGGWLRAGYRVVAGAIRGHSTREGGVAPAPG